MGGWRAVIDALADVMYIPHVYTEAVTGKESTAQLGHIAAVIDQGQWFEP